MSIANQNDAGDETGLRITASGGDPPPSARTQSVSQPERIAVICPSCQATLSIRRIYIGNQVRCKNCQHIFAVTAPVSHEPAPATNGTHSASVHEARQPAGERTAGLEREYERLSVEHARLLSVHEQLQGAHRDLEAQRDRLTAVNKALAERLEDRDTELSAARAEHDQQQLEIARGTDEIEGMRAALEERDRALRDQADELRAQAESHERALDHAGRVHREEIERLSAELAAMAQEYGRAQDEQRSTKESCQLLERRNHELTAAHERLERLNHDMTAVLGSMGVRFTLPG